ncbi:hypothetical protein E2C01_066708 [Portunus trituberculatus]|uniref:Uncharacterized protein n=1 Tax=Portunus trituberculatus TaxID=210409 RepID=A0A5B7HVE5_PORTR|nr:hypothetical protein [Portunus trituberculatus]
MIQGWPVPLRAEQHNPSSLFLDLILVLARASFNAARPVIRILPSVLLSAVNAAATLSALPFALASVVQAATPAARISLASSSRGRLGEGQAAHSGHVRACST